MHRDAGNEIYEYACSNEDKDDIDFEMVYMPGDGVTYESFSSLGVSQDLSIASGFHSGKDSIPVNTIKVNCRKLDTILDLANADKVDYLIVDVEGWELNVMRGFSTLKYRPRVIVLENGIPSTHQSYHDFMNNIGYTFDSFDETTGPNLVYYNYNF
jgi:FkbM family methyltransferase